jgi:hypothetical protein
LEEKRKITNIKYKQMDRDSEIKETTNNMERLILGDKGVGILKELGLTPGKIQKYLDEQWDRRFSEILEEHKEYIFWESRKRSTVMVQEWLSRMNESDTPFNQDELTDKMREALKVSEIEVVKELIEEHL